LRIAAAPLNRSGGETRLPLNQGNRVMRILETAAASVVALAAQILVVATVMI
jgi:hypothetical protein